jgi:hypothetical protein
MEKKKRNFWAGVTSRIMKIDRVTLAEFQRRPKTERWAPRILKTRPIASRNNIVFNSTRLKSKKNDFGPIAGCHHWWYRVQCVTPPRSRPPGARDEPSRIRDESSRVKVLTGTDHVAVTEPSRDGISSVRFSSLNSTRSFRIINYRSMHVHTHSRLSAIIADPSSSVVKINNAPSVRLIYILFVRRAGLACTYRYCYRNVTMSFPKPAWAIRNHQVRVHQK